MASRWRSVSSPPIAFVYIPTFRTSTVTASRRVSSTAWTIKERAGSLKETQLYLWGGEFWEESYYVGTAGDVSSNTIEQYLNRTEHV